MSRDNPDGAPLPHERQVTLNELHNLLGSRLISVVALVSKGVNGGPEIATLKLGFGSRDGDNQFLLFETDGDENLDVRGWQGPFCGPLVPASEKAGQYVLTRKQDSAWVGQAEAAPSVVEQARPGGGAGGGACPPAREAVAGGA